MLIKGGKVLDALAGCRTVAFDKTGTLTTGQLECTGIAPPAPQSTTEQSTAVGAHPPCCPLDADLRCSSSFPEVCWCAMAGLRCNGRSAMGRSPVRAFDRFCEVQRVRSEQGGPRSMLAASTSGASRGTSCGHVHTRYLEGIKWKNIQ